MVRQQTLFSTAQNPSIAINNLSNTQFHCYHTISSYSRLGLFGQFEIDGSFSTATGCFSLPSICADSSIAVATFSIPRKCYLVLVCKILRQLPLIRPRPLSPPLPSQTTSRADSTYDITLIVTSAQGCSDTLTQSTADLWLDLPCQGPSVDRPPYRPLIPLRERD